MPVKTSAEAAEAAPVASQDHLLERAVLAALQRETGAVTGVRGNS
jgi:hypothetical protein